MESETAVRRLAALAQSSRLSVFRLLVKAGHEGLPAGEIARSLAIAPNTLSAQLNLLAQAGLVTNRREGRSLIYSAQFEQMAELLVYLMDDCCHGHADVCGPIVEAAARGECCDTENRPA
ncbi:metalloregulator ArsR/SmtB family transcription factor [Maricaulis sp.]|jgi:DNA-binding transcriptional ArsR family regulator|uniref:ArsR/SmtB family transcription factor n=1 Tax=Maricaulis sp. TaxID=1486257 RepID=UPI0026229B38|nr:metalloregulator ArsR/SmtB family transcription factor [Maricaulis sp.]